MSTRRLQHLLIALSASYCVSSGIHAATDGSVDKAARVASELIDAASPGKESKQQFFQRFGPTYRRLAATKLMAQEVAGPWQTMSSAERAEFTELYEKVVMATLHGAYDAALPARFMLLGGDLRRSRSGVISQWCAALSIDPCVFYSARTKANDMVVEYRLLELGSGWQVVDVVVNQLSVQGSYASTFREQAPSQLLERLRDRVARY